MRSLDEIAIVAAASLLLGCAPVGSPPQSKVSLDGEFGIEFAKGFPPLELVETGRGPDGANYEVVRGDTRILFVLEGSALGFPLVSGGTVRRQSANPVAVNIVGGRVKEYRFRYHRAGEQDLYVAVVVVPTAGPDRDLAEQVARSICVD